MSKSYNEARNELANRNTVEELISLVRETSVVPEGKGNNVIYLLYNNYFNDDPAFRLSNEIVKNNTNYVSIDQTPASKLLKSRAFIEKLENAFKNKYPDDLNRAKQEFNKLMFNWDANGKRSVVDKDNLSLWDETSRRYVEEADGNFRTVLGDRFADMTSENLKANLDDMKSSVFYQTEIDAVLQKSGRTIDNVPIEEFAKMKDAKAALISNAYQHTLAGELSLHNYQK